MKIGHLRMCATAISIMMRTIALATLLGVSLARLALAAGPGRQTEANVMVELPFAASIKHDDPFNTITLDVIFTDPAGRELRVPAFWAGEQAWKVRYASPVVGTHRYRSECSDTNDRGLHGVVGQVQIHPYSGNNPFYAHGAIQVAADRRHLEYADGTPFFWLADTWWMGLCHRLRWPDEVDSTSGRS